MIRIAGVTHHYGIRKVLRNVTLEVKTGEVACVMGPNGMGKTTLLGIVAGVLWPVRGSVEIDGMRRRRSAQEELAIRKKLVYLPDHPWLPKSRTGREFLLNIGRMYGIKDERLMDHADRLLQVFDLAEKGDSPMDSYSNGEKKKIAVAAALATEAPIMILDEPFSGGLDPSALLALRRILERLAQTRGVTILMALPVPEIAEGLADRIAILRHGEIVVYDSLEGLREKTGSPGSLGEILEHLISPQTLDNVENYIRSR